MKEVVEMHNEEAIEVAPDTVRGEELTRELAAACAALEAEGDEPPPCRSEAELAEFMGEGEPCHSAHLCWDGE